MEHLTAIILPIATLCAIYFCMYMKNRKDKASLNKVYNQDASDVKVESETLTLLHNALVEIGCKPVLDNDGILSVKYNGDEFNVQFIGRYARIWNPAWTTVRLNGPDFSTMLEAMNAANHFNMPTVFMSPSDHDDEIINLNSRQMIMLHPACPDNKYYVKGVLDSFFRVREDVNKHYRKIEEQQAEIKKKRRPIGIVVNEQD